MALISLMFLLIFGYSERLKAIEYQQDLHCTGSIDLRRYPTKNSDKYITKVDCLIGDSKQNVKILETKNGYHKISYHNLVGWISDDAINPPNQNTQNFYCPQIGVYIALNEIVFDEKTGGAHDTFIIQNKKIPRGAFVHVYGPRDNPSCLVRILNLPEDDKLDTGSGEDRDATQEKKKEKDTSNGSETTKQEQKPIKPIKPETENSQNDSISSKKEDSSKTLVKPLLKKKDRVEPAAEGTVDPKDLSGALQSIKVSDRLLPTLSLMDVISVNPPETLIGYDIQAQEIKEFDGSWVIDKIEGAFVFLRDPSNQNNLHKIDLYSFNTGYQRGSFSLDEAASITSFGTSMTQEKIKCPEKEDGDKVASVDSMNWEQENGECTTKGYYIKHFPSDNTTTARQYPNGSEELEMLQCINNSVKDFDLGRYHEVECDGKVHQIKVNDDSDNSLWPKTVAGSTKNPSKKGGYRPCASKELITFLTDSFLKSMKCLGLKPKDLFPMINHESHFQLNSMSTTGALGVGQIVQNTYNGLRTKLNEKYNNLGQGKQTIADLMGTIRVIPQEQLEELDANCQELMDMAKEVKPQDEHWTGRSTDSNRLCGSYNPSREFLLTGLLYIENKKSAMKLLEQHSDWTTGKREKMGHLLAVWMHNGGESAISQYYNQFVGKDSQNKPNVETFKDDFKKYIEEDKTITTNEKRRNEIANFLGRVLAGERSSLSTGLSGDFSCGSL